MKKISLTFALLILGATLAGCSGQTQSTDTASSETTISTTTAAKETAAITLVKDKQSFSDKKVSFEEGANLMDVLKANFDVTEKDGFITAIEGVKQDAGKNLYWVFTVNGKQVSTSAADTILKAGDKVEFEYAQF